MRYQPTFQTFSPVLELQEMVGIDHAMRLFLTAAESVEMTAHKRSNPIQKQTVLKRKNGVVLVLKNK